MRKIVLKSLVFLFVFSLGFILSELRFTDRRGNSYQPAGVFVYDTEQKIEDYYTMFERQFSKEEGKPLESPEVKEFMAMVREQGRPLVAAGPFAVFVDNTGGTFSVRDISPKLEGALFFPFVELKISEQSKRLDLISSQEKGGKMPRFRAQFVYSKDGVYEKGSFAVHREDETLERIYIDSKGIGVFDLMRVFENDVQYVYSLNDLTWKLKRELPYPDKLKDTEAHLSLWKQRRLLVQPSDDTPKTSDSTSISGANSKIDQFDSEERVD